ncbi:MAG: hypothetical protein LAP40_21215 [Acidobacteriia bacterium]|nr:hypothetical protein [Terriglobia bacterium]
MSESEIQQLLSEYLEGHLGQDELDCLFDLDESDETDLSRHLVGLLSEASHAHWTRKELRKALRPFANIVWREAEGVPVSKGTSLGYRSSSTTRPTEALLPAA